MSVSEGVLQGQMAHKCTDITTKYKFLQLDTSECSNTETVLELAGAGGQVYGVSATETAVGGRSVTFNTTGECWLTVNGHDNNISVGDRLKSAASGIGVKIASDHDEVGAIALAAATADAATIRVRLVPLTLYEVG